MPIEQNVYDWRLSLVPSSQLFVAGGQSIAGGLTIGGAAIEHVSPGGRGRLMMQFSTVDREANVDASWTYSRLLNGAVMRVPVWVTDQLVPSDVLNPPTTDGIPWANGQPWASGENWGWNPTAPVTAASRGAVEVTVDLSDYGQVIAPGHVIGFTVGNIDTTHIVMDIETEGDLATLTIEPPLRRSLASDDRLRFRPMMLVTCRNPREFAGTFGMGIFTQPGAGEFVEALL